MLDKVCVVIPSLDPDEKLCATIEGLKKIGFTRFVVVDDGSAAENKSAFPESDQNITLLGYDTNRGKGYALKTAFSYIAENMPDTLCVVTVDGDGQHHPNDVLACVKACQNTDFEKVILGCRDFSLASVPPKSRFGNRTTSLIFRLICGIKISDTQTGLRVFPFSLLPTLNTIKGDRFEYETNMLIKFKQLGIEFAEKEIETLYFDQNQGTHFRVIADSIRVYGFLINYIMSSLASFGIDLLLFFLINLFGRDFLGASTILVATALARIVSSLTNFTINRRKVFDDHTPLWKTFLKYYSVVIPQMFVSAGLVYALSIIIHSTTGLDTVFKVLVDTFLFFISYRIQQSWVFADKKRVKKIEIKKEKAKATPKKVILRSLLCVATAIVLLVATVFSAGLILANGPSTTIRDMLVLSAKQASATKWLPGLFLSEQTINEILENSQKVNTDVIDLGSIQTTPDEWADSVNGAKLEFISKPNFKAYVILVKEPSRIKVGVSSDNFASATVGMNIFDAVKKYNAFAAINGGEFSDIGGRGTGAAPMGLTYSFGKNVWSDGGKRTFIGFDNNDTLVCREGLTKAEADSLGIRDGVSFQTGNVLIEQSGEQVKLHYSDKNTGTAQRTAIGQRADGTVVMLVTDGRSASSIGATKNDVIDILVEYGCCRAGMLDGGSSAMMFFKDYAKTYNLDVSALDTYQQQGMVNHYKAFTLPRTLPTYFIVTEE